LEKGKGARILDKRQDSGKVVKLVEELGRAILLYQVGTHVEILRSGWADAFGIAIATTVHRKSGHAVDCRSPLDAFTLRADGRSIESSLFSVHFWKFAR
jgi:hypothetical protein